MKRDIYSGGVLAQRGLDVDQEFVGLTPHRGAAA